MEGAARFRLEAFEVSLAVSGEGTIGQWDYRLGGIYGRGKFWSASLSAESWQIASTRLRFMLLSSMARTRLPSILM